MHPDINSFNQYYSNPSMEMDYESSDMDHVPPNYSPEVLFNQIRHLENELKISYDALRKLKRENRILSESLANSSSEYSLASLLHHVDEDVSRGLTSLKASNLVDSAEVVLNRASKIELGEKIIPPPRLISPLSLQGNENNHSTKSKQKSNSKSRSKDSSKEKSKSYSGHQYVEGENIHDDLIGFPREKDPTSSSSGSRASPSKAKASKKRNRAESPASVPGSPENSKAKIRAKRAVLTHGMEILEDNFPVLPVTLGTFTLLDLGKICTKDGYHTDSQIYPVGFKTTRNYASAIHRDATTSYTSSIEEGPNGPIFQVIAADNPDHPYRDSNPTSCWSSIIRAVNRIRGRSHVGQANGLEYFGLTQSMVLYWLQRLPDADKLLGYQRQDVVLVDNRARGAAVAAARAAVANPSDQTESKTSDVPPGSLDGPIEHEDMSEAAENPES